jgi:hypothetical protein
MTIIENEKKEAFLYGEASKKELYLKASVEHIDDATGEYTVKIGENTFILPSSFVQEEKEKQKKYKDDIFEQGVIVGHHSIYD